MQRLKREIASLEAQLSKLQESQSALRPGDTEVSASRIPKVAVEYTRRLRDVKYHEALFDILSKQYAAARIDEAKSAPLIQVVDRATPPDKKSGPIRWLIIFGAGAGGLLLSCLYALADDSYRKFKASSKG
ncbi:MAG TPA: GNVR domain-containing protein [Acidobacteriaceae bacterium]|nr:GNVR domain-containing protein [Acidobacteriaceae bacterium]